jgi:hypothetical protein
VLEQAFQQVRGLRGGSRDHLDVEGSRFPP